MATASAILCPATVTARVRSSGSTTRKAEKKVVYIGGLNCYGGLRAHNSVTAMGVPVCTEQCFAKVVSSLRTKGRGGGGGALSSTCNAVAEIFRIAAIMNGLVLVGVAVGFVLLRMEAFVEESE